MMTINDMLVPTDVDHDESFFHYYDRHPTQEDLMPESTAKAHLIQYLLNVLTWLYHAQHWFVTTNIGIYRSREWMEYPVAPDIAVFKGVVVTDPAARSLRSWRLYEPDRPTPQVVFELASEATWQDDLDTKPAKYAALQVREYFAYDPNNPPYWTPTMGRLRGWRLTGDAMVEMQPDARGWLWSDELDSWLVPDGAFLRLYDRAEQRRLTEGAAERQAKEVERQAKEVERQAKEVERQAKEVERQAKEVERQAKEVERQAKNRAWAKLRELGIDPESLGE